MKPATHGGARANAGRPRKPNKKKPLALSITPRAHRQLAALARRSRCSKAVAIERLLANPPPAPPPPSS